jgi:hypothetical protein
MDEKFVGFSVTVQNFRQFAFAILLLTHGINFFLKNQPFV